MLDPPLRDPYYFRNGSCQKGVLLPVVHSSQVPSFQRERCQFERRVRPASNQAKYAVATTAAPVASTLQETTDTYSQEGATASHQASANVVRKKKAISERLNPKNTYHAATDGVN